MKTEHPYFGRRLVVASIVVCVVLSLISVRLWYLQCLKGSYYRLVSERNRKRIIRTVPPRGIIYDRDGRVLVRNRPAFHIALMLEDTPDVDHTLEELAGIVGRDIEELRYNLDSQRSGRFVPKVVLWDVSRKELAMIKVNTYRLPGVIVEAVPTRAYPYESLAAQLVGYTREITREQLDRSKNRGDDRYQSGDMIGQAGLEKMWEEALRGEPGSIMVEVDARGNRKGELGIVAAEPGRDLHLTIDIDLQQTAEQALADKKGAVVALDPRNGEVLVLASSPSYDPNLFSGKMLASDWRKLSTDKSKPLTNRAIASIYPPGSTFKLLLAFAGLAEGIVTPETKLNCPGYFMFAGRPYHCHKRSGHGKLDIKQAVTVSCNAFFFQLGNQLGIEKIHRYATMLGLGDRTGINLPGEEGGVVPNDSWKRKRFGERWYPGETLSVSIGQGALSVTPLQMALAVSAIANGGTLFRPTLVRRVASSMDGFSEEISVEAVYSLDVNPQIFSQVRSYAVEVVQNEKGTGKRAALDGISVGGKTGTAQVTALSSEDVGEALKDHAWFVSFAPAEEPTIAMAVVVENSGHGGEAAAPVSKAVMEVYFHKAGLLPLTENEEVEWREN